MHSDLQMIILEAKTGVKLEFRFDYECPITSNSKNLIVDSPPELLYISVRIRYANLILDQNNNRSLIILIILIIRLLNNV